MATHSSILAWRIPWTEEPAGLQFVRLQELDTTERSLSFFKDKWGHKGRALNIDLVSLHKKEEKPDLSTSVSLSLYHLRTQ